VAALNKISLAFGRTIIRRAEKVIECSAVDEIFKTNILFFAPSASMRWKHEAQKVWSVALKAESQRYVHERRRYRRNI
jgi:hypothetical protein